jgi:hypothetical protein
MSFSKNCPMHSQPSNKILVGCQKLKALHKFGVNVPCDKADPLVFLALSPSFQRTLPMQVLSERKLRFTTQSVGKILDPHSLHLH